MEVLRSEEFYVFIKEDVSLRWNRSTGEFSCGSAWDLSGLEDLECLGTTPAIIGKIEHDTVYEPRLMIVKECSPVGKLYDEHVIYKIRSIRLLTLGAEDSDYELNPCERHRSEVQESSTNVFRGREPRRETPGKGIFEGSQFVNKTWGAVKSAGNTIKNTTQQAAAIATSQVKQTVRKRTDSTERDRLEKRITEELHKIFDDSDSFYFCPTADVTNSLQRLENVDVTAPGARWRYADERFFWNKHMLRDILNLGIIDCDPWVIPIIQGHVQIRQCEVDAGEYFKHLNTESLRDTTSNHKESFTLSLISRRSRFRAGTRYKRRGVDENGHVANYVETEQSLVHHSHRVSFVQVRGSAPLYWSQPGLKYRPPPKLDRGEQESQVAFDKHFEEERGIYGPVCIVNLVEQSGRERVIWDAYSNHIYAYNSPDITYTTFDFHEYCRGMHFENVSVLINALTDVITDMGYCWRDPQGYICRQNGVFRVNCIDCLDRTNVVQTAIAKAVLKMQVTRLGLSGPDWPLPSNLRTILHELWADNGDIISRQYAGTNALKGDYTRTGERKFTGIMKDGMNSANRYYVQHFTDAFRQCCIDLILGNVIHDSDIDQEMDSFLKLRTAGQIAGSVLVPDVVEMSTSSLVPIYFNQAVRDELLVLNVVYGLSSYYLSRFKDAFRQATIDLLLGEAEVTELMLQHDGSESEDERHATAEHVKQLIEDCKKLLISEPQNVVGAWGLIDADPGTGDPHETEMDTILILTRDSYLVADYDDQSDRVTKFQQMALTDITLIEFGVPESSSQMSLMNLKSNLSLSGKKASENAPCIRINYKIDNQDGYFHMFRSTNLRFFNNMAIYVKTTEEIFESLRSICECFLVTIEVAGFPKVPFKHGTKMERKKSKVRPSSGTGGGRKALYLELTNIPGITRNLSETQLAIKSAGSKALTNMSEQFSKLNKLGPTFHLGKTSSKKGRKKHTKGANSDCTSSDNSSEDEGKTNIFEPTLDNFENCQRYIGDNPYAKPTTDTKNKLESQQSDQNSEAYLIENPLYSSKIDHSTSGDAYESEYLYGIGASIPQIDVSNSESQAAAKAKNSLPLKLNPFDVESDSQPRGDYVRSATPEITIDCPTDSTSKSEPTDGKKVQPPSSLKLNQKLSHSSGEVDVNTDIVTLLDDGESQTDQAKSGDTIPPVRSSSQQNINISQSQSESALKQFKNITSPVASATKDLVLSPFSKLAKGVQSFGANLDPRKIKSGATVKHITEQQYEEHKKFQEKWRKCNTRLIAL